MSHSLLLESHVEVSIFVSKSLGISQIFSQDGQKYDIKLILYKLISQAAVDLIFSKFSKYR